MAQITKVLTDVRGQYKSSDAYHNGGVCTLLQASAWEKSTESHPRGMQQLPSSLLPYLRHLDYYNSATGVARQFI